MVHTPRTAPPPAELVRHGRRWSVRFRSIVSGSVRGDWATKSAKRILGAALRRLAHGKCVYCEGKLDTQSYLEVEHYVAKMIAPDLAFEWTNLLPVCQICNNTKSDQDHGNILLKPDDEDPEPYFWIHPDTGKLEPHPKLDQARARRANETIRLCNLQRPALCEERFGMLRRVGRWSEQVARSGPLTAVLEEEWNDLCDPRMQYKFVLRHALELRGQHVLAEYDRARFRSAII
jgi:uncharacterized protein (TIGR02646 family)